MRIDPDLPTGVVEQAVTWLLRAESQKSLAENERVHQLLAGGAGRAPHRCRGDPHRVVWLVDWEQAAVNDWLVVHQYTVVEGGKNRRADVVVFLNGLPIALLELKKTGVLSTASSPTAARTFRRVLQPGSTRPLDAGGGCGRDAGSAGQGTNR